MVTGVLEEPASSIFRVEMTLLNGDSKFLLNVVTHLAHYTI
jgi:hypothetical protein